MIDNKIILFVRNTLGCDCPEEVFQTIACAPAVCLREDVVLDCAVTMGNRLLVYVFSPTNTADIKQHLAFLVSTGMRERDIRGLNRFRLVMATDNGEDPVLLESVFDTLKGSDEKVHLHLISKKENIFCKNTERQ